jgi:two-component system, OmpR family, phosphate regulon response regulator OmpR
MNIRIWFVGDDPPTLGTLSDFLESRGMAVYMLDCSRSLTRHMKQDIPSLIVLRDGSPNVQATAVLRTLHNAGNDTPVIVIGEPKDTVDAVLCLELGAEDYLRMPCDPHELFARIQNVLRRRLQNGQWCLPGLVKFELGSIALDFRAQSVTRDGSPVTLHPSLFPLLHLFVEHPLRVLSRRAIVAKLRDSPVAYSERSLDVLVWRLRQVLEPDPSLPRFIQTIRGRGYVFSPSGTGAHPADFEKPDATLQTQPALRRTEPHPQSISS